MLKHFDPRRFLCRSAGVSLLVSSVFVLGACGGGDSSSSGTTAQTLPKAQFIARANAICVKGDAELNRTARHAFGGPNATVSQRADYATNTAIPIVERMVGDLRALPTPPDADRFNAILSAADQELTAVKQQPGNFGDQAFPRTDKLAHVYGLPAC